MLDTDMMPEHPEYLLGHRIFRNPIMIVQAGLRPPADMKGRINMSLAPLHDFGHFIPVSHFFKRHIFHRSPGDNHTIVFLVAHLIKRSIKLRQIIHRRMARRIGFRINKIHFDLKRAVSQQAQQLRFRDILDRHQVQNQNLQRTDILTVRPVSIHHKDVLPFKNMRCRQRIRYFYRHKSTSSNIPLSAAVRQAPTRRDNVFIIP